MLKITSHRARGYTLAEAPAFFYFLFIGVTIPMICFATMFFRSLGFFFSVRDATNQAAKAPTFSSSTDSATAIPPITSAQTISQNTYKRDVAGWPGVSGTYSIAILTKPLSGGAPSSSPTALAQNSTNTNNVYFIQGTGVGMIQPLFPVGNFMGLNVPGLSGPYPLTINVEAYVENPVGLTN